MPICVWYPQFWHHSIIQQLLSDCVSSNKLTLSVAVSYHTYDYKKNNTILKNVFDRFYLLKIGILTSWSTDSLPIMQPEISLPCSQWPTTGPYSDSHHNTIFSMNNFKIILLSMSRTPRVSYFQFYWTNFTHNFTPCKQATCSIHPILLNLNMKLLIMQLFPSSSYFVHLNLKNSAWPPVFKHTQMAFFP